MPVIRVSNEAYQKILRLQAEDGNAMSIFIDRLMAKVVPDDGHKDGGTAKGRAKKRARGKTRKTRKWLLGIEGLSS
jgi:hypothetical protein